jgi:transposase
MMGERRSGQDALFYEFSLERHVPVEHLLRSIDRFVDLDGVGCELAPFYSDVGRPSIDPELMIRMLIVGYCFGIRSERRLCEEVHLNLGYRWFCRLGLDGAVPDHSTFSKNRHGRFRDSDLLRRLFEMTVQRCIAEGLVGGEGFAVDASMIKADANRQRSVPGGRPPRRRTMPCASIWRFSMMPRLARQRRSCRSLSRPPTRAHAGRARMAAWPSSPTAPTT